MRTAAQVLAELPAPEPLKPTDPRLVFSIDRGAYYVGTLYDMQRENVRYREVHDG